MDNEEQSTETLNTDESQDLNTEEQVVEKSEAEIRAEKAEKKALDQELRAKKAEQELKALKTQTEKPTPKNEQKYSLEEIDDIAALASVPKEDRQEVLDHAKFKGITPSEALKSTYIKTYLREQEEQRKSANAANTGGSKRGASKPSGTKILEDFHSGKIPESEEGIKDLVDAQWENKKKRT